MEKSVNEILKKTLKHYIDLEYYANGVDLDVQDLFAELKSKCDAFIESQKSYNTKDSYNLTYKAIKELVEEFGRKLQERLEEEAAQVMQLEEEFLDNLYNKKETKKEGSIAKKAALTIGGVTFSKLLFAPIDGRDTTKQFVERTTKNILRSYDMPMRSGYLFGQSAESIKTQAENQLKQVSRGMGNAIKTAIPSYAKTTDKIIFINNDLEVVWVATLDGRTCIQCASLSGIHFKSASLAPSTHILCRCILIPVKDISEPVPDYEEFIKSLSEEEQEQVLGKSRYEMYKNGVPLEKFINNGTVIKLEDLDLNYPLVKRRELYRSKSGGIISATYKIATSEESRNINALKPFADEGKKAVLLFATNHNRVRTADSLIENVKWEIKTITDKTQNLKSAIDSAIRKAHTQADRVILNFEIPIDEKTMKAYLENRVRQHQNIAEIAIEFNGQNKQQYTRKEIMDWYNDNEIKTIVDSLKKKKP